SKRSPRARSSRPIRRPKPRSTSTTRPRARHPTASRSMLPESGGDSPQGVEGRRVVLGVTGGIAAYKAVEVCRRLVDAGAHVVPVLSEGALHFVGKATFDALGSERAHVSLWDDEHPIPHTVIGQQADLVVVAPATARLLGTYAAGISDDLLTNVLLAT